MKALILSSSPRQDGNSATLASEALSGLRDAGHEVTIRDLNAHIGGFLGDCRTCRQADGGCGIRDGYRDMFLNDFLPAEGLIVATPIYWYGMSAQLKAFFDRMFCYVAASHPGSPDVLARIQQKRVGLLMSSEETFPTVSHGIVHQVQEFSRYTNSAFVGFVHGHGNARGDVKRDPGDPLKNARRFGRDFFNAHATDYRIDTFRRGKMWADAICDDTAVAL
ncbi:MAG: flavodoxin family protein [Pseudomonadota bacterium]